MPSLPLFTSTRLRAIEREYCHEPLMQRAGAAAAVKAEELASDRPGAILVCAGPGNNGGDAFETARLLLQRHFEVVLVFNGDLASLPTDARAAHERFLSAGGCCLDEIPPGMHWRLIIDGLFGIGLKQSPTGIYASRIAEINALAKENSCRLLALDCPSGLNADTGQTPGTAVRASHTITFIAAKPGLFTADGPDHAGEISIAGLGLSIDDQAEGHSITQSQFSGQLKPRNFNSHKGNYGSAGIIGGAHSMVGAVFLAGRAALRLGAGRVYLGLLAPEAPPIDDGQPELMLRKPDGLFGANLAALACGPGMGTSLQAAALLEHALDLPIPLVLDADAINLLAFENNLQTLLTARLAPTVLTPHPVEAARLLDVSAQEVQNDRIAAAVTMAERFGCHVALKGCGTVIAAPDGRWWINATGNPGLASAGSGDVLTGLILALLAQGWPMESATLAAVHLHGAAADRLVAAGEGPIGLTASELITPARRLFNEWISGSTHAH